MLGKIGEDFPVQHYVFLVQCPDQLGVRQAKLAGAGVDLDIPKFAIVGLLVFAVGKRIASGVQ